MPCLFGGQVVLMVAAAGASMLLGQCSSDNTVSVRGSALLCMAVVAVLACMVTVPAAPTMHRVMTLNLSHFKRYLSLSLLSALPSVGSPPGHHFDFVTSCGHK